MTVVIRLDKPDRKRQIIGKVVDYGDKDSDPERMWIEYRPRKKGLGGALFDRNTVVIEDIPKRGGVLKISDTRLDEDYWIIKTSGTDLNGDFSDIFEKNCGEVAEMLARAENDLRLMKVARHIDQSKFTKRRDQLIEEEVKAKHILNKQQPETSEQERDKKRRTLLGDE